MISGGVKYGYALLDGSGNLISIDQVKEACQFNPGYRTLHRFSCPHCLKGMYATLGEVYVRHFRHNGEKCKPDGYLHSLAERLFFEEYNRCLQEHVPFLIEVQVERRCSANCMIKGGKCPRRNTTKVVDLTEVYTKLSVEERVDVGDHYRRPDILLESEEGKQLWIEFWVNHETEAKKRNDAAIVEIRLKTEDDLSLIRQHHIKDDKGMKVFLWDLHNDFCEPEECDKPYSNPPAKRQIAVPKRPVQPIPEPVSTPGRVKVEWIDLGLPSGMLWANMDGAPENPNNAALPTRRDMEELKECCALENVDGQLFVTGPNGKSIVLNSVRYRLSSHTLYTNKDRFEPSGTDIVTIDSLPDGYMHFFYDDISSRHHLRYVLKPSNGLF